MNKTEIILKIIIIILVIITISIVVFGVYKAFDAIYCVELCESYYLSEEKVAVCSLNPDVKGKCGC